MKIFEGTILTVNEEDQIAKYLVEESGKILFVGNELPEEYQGRAVQKIEGALVPAFVDTHLHFASLALFHTGINVMDVKSNLEMIQKLSAFEKQNKSKIIIGFGASPYSVKEKKLVNKEELDTVSLTRPIMIVKYDGHACIINSVLLAKLPEKIKSMRGYDAESGEMNQEAFFAVTDFVSSSVSTIQLIASMKKTMDFMASRGIGMMHSVSGVGFPGDLDVDMERFLGRGALHGFQTRLFFQTMDTQKVVKRSLPRIGGCFATALDGCFGSQDAALNNEYEGTDNKGVLYYSDEEVTNFCKEANRLGLQIELHAIGDRAFDQAARAIDAALCDFPRINHRHGIIHACLPTEEGLELCKKNQIQLPIQSAFIIWPQEPDWYLQQLLGEREKELNPVRTFLDLGLHVSLGSDAPCTDPEPLLWIHNACNHPVKEQSISVQQALRMATWEGCYATFDEAKRGSLEVGKFADMVILDQDPYKISTEKLKDIKVKTLYLNGKPYKEQRLPGILMILNGMVKGLFHRGMI